MTPGEGESRWAGRTRAREAALQILYQAEVGQLSITDASHVHGEAGAPDVADLSDDDRAYAESLARGVWAARRTLDDWITEASTNWRVERMTVLDRMLLRLAAHEIADHPGTPPRVVIDEAIDLARRYSGDEAAKFVNGVLDGIYRKLKEERKVIE